MENLLVMGSRKNIALVAHDNKKSELLEWTMTNAHMLKNHNLFATGTTGRIIKENSGMDVTSFKSGPLGGDQQLGAKIVGFEIDCLLFFWDPLESQPHDPDIKALLRVATLYNIPMATNKATADFIISSPLFNTEYKRDIDDFSSYYQRKITV